MLQGHYKNPYINAIVIMVIISIIMCMVSHI